MILNLIKTHVVRGQAQSNEPCELEPHIVVHAIEANCLLAGFISCYDVSSYFTYHFFLVFCFFPDKERKLIVDILISIFRYI